MVRRKKNPETLGPVDHRPLLTRKTRIYTDIYCLPEGDVEFKYPSRIRPESLGLLLRFLGLQMEKLQQLAQHGPRQCDEEDCAKAATLFSYDDERAWCDEDGPKHGQVL